MLARPYRAADRSSWNRLNQEARNGNFLYDRSFMEYHSDRFEDSSIMISLDGNDVALMPANRVADVVYSHQGLTFGGLVLSDSISQEQTVEIFSMLTRYYRDANAARLVYKPLPMIYHARPANEDLYALFRHDARLIRRDASTTIDYGRPGKIASRRLRGMKKALKEKLVFEVSRDWDGFWPVLSEALQTRHSVVPVHSSAEIEALSDAFPDNIKLILALNGSDIVAGIVVFLSCNVAHAQYIATSLRGREIGALDGLFAFAIKMYGSEKRYFDFGISTEENGSSLNVGLAAQKEGFGGSTTVHDVYELDL